MAKEVQPIEVGDRFETKDRRDEGRVVEVVKVFPMGITEEELMADVAQLAHVWGEPADVVEDWLRGGYIQFHIRTEAHPKNPDAVGRVSRIRLRTLREKYRKVSR